jgi:hypothetical protein
MRLGEGREGGESYFKNQEVTLALRDEGKDCGFVGIRL